VTHEGIHIEVIGDRGTQRKNLHHHPC
jgi:hypothetical protein